MYTKNVLEVGNIPIGNLQVLPRETFSSLPFETVRLRPEKWLNGQQRRHWRADDYGWKESILRAEKQLVKWRLEGFFGPSLPMYSSYHEFLYSGV